MRPWRPPFHASTVVRKGSSKRVSSQDPLLRKFGNFSLYSLNFCPNFSSQAPKFENFLLTSPQIWKFSVHKPPNGNFQFISLLFRGKYQFASPTLRKSGPHTPTWTKVEYPPVSLSKYTVLKKRNNKFKEINIMNQSHITHSNSQWTKQYWIKVGIFSRVRVQGNISGLVSRVTVPRPTP